MAPFKFTFAYTLFSAVILLCSTQSHAHTPSRFSKDMEIVRKKQVLSQTCTLEITINNSEFAPGIQKHVEAFMHDKGYKVSTGAFKKRSNPDGKIATDFGPTSDLWLYIDLEQYLLPSSIEVDLTRFIYADTFRRIIKPDHAELYFAKRSKSLLGMSEKTIERVLKILKGIRPCQLTQ